MKKISIVTPTYNEDQNIEKLILEVRKIMVSLKSKYVYEHIVIDNKSTDNTINILKKINQKAFKKNCWKQSDKTSWKSVLLINLVYIILVIDQSGH